MMMQLVAFKSHARIGHGWDGRRAAARLSRHTSVVMMLRKGAAGGRIGRGAAEMMMIASGILRRTAMMMMETVAVPRGGHGRGSVNRMRMMIAVLRTTMAFKASYSTGDNRDGGRVVARFARHAGAMMMKAMMTIQMGGRGGEGGGRGG